VSNDEAKNRASIDAFWQAWNEERLDDAIALYAPDARLRHFTHGIDVTGTKSIRDLMAMSLATIPGRRSDLSAVFSVGDHVITENRFHGTMADSGQPVTNNICYIFQLSMERLSNSASMGRPYGPATRPPRAV
jgi:ketosteroid isomerase-like protein